MGVYDGVYPGPNDIIITGRSFEERPETSRMLESKGIKNRVFYNPLPFANKTRVSSGKHKANILLALRSKYDVGIHFEDDPWQMDEIHSLIPQQIVVLLQHNLVEKGNIRHAY